MEGDKNGFALQLNRIRTQPVRCDESSSGGDDSPASKLATAMGAWKLGRGCRAAGQEMVPVRRNRKGRRKANKIARWFSSYFTRNHHKAMNQMPYNSKCNRSDTFMHNKNEIIVVEFAEDESSNSGMHIVAEGNITKKVGLSKKSFSHELQRNAGPEPALVRTYSYKNLMELIGSFHLKFDAAKESINAQLDTLAIDMMNALEHNSFAEDQIKPENILSLIQHCMKMTSHEFREGCERIVKDLAEMRHQCLHSPLRHFITRMLLILTRCTRLLQVQKDSEKMNEASLDKFKEFLDSVPAVGSTQLPKPSPELNCFLNNHLDNNEIAIHSSESIAESTTISSKYLPNSNHGEATSNESRNLQHGHQTYYDRVDSVLCRICEEDVPASHWKFHSYICACADQCDLDGLDIDERLQKIAELLELFVEFYNTSSQASCSSPEISGTESISSPFGSESYSPKLQEWQSKDMEGMFEDIHEIDTACLDNLNITTAENLRRALAMKLGASFSTSSNGSVTPSATTPRSSQLDAFWLEHSSCIDFEDPDKMIEIAYIARKAADINLASDNSPNLLNNQLNELEDILQQSQLKALIIDTFGNRTKHLIEEKQLLAVELSTKGGDAGTIHHEQGNSQSIIEDHHSSSSAPLVPSYKDRTTIDDFDIIKPISRGAFGKVFLAQKRTTGDLFAIKVLKKMDMIRKNDAERILAERAILIKVRNPFVVRFFYSFTSSDNLYLVMEYLNGGDLFSLLRKVGCLEENIAKTYIAELVLALEYLHSLGIVHRDLKPDNILIGPDGHIKLTDFGLSKIGLLDSAMELSVSGTTGLTSLGSENQSHFPSDAHQRAKRSRRSAVGTPDYLAPEILLGTAHGFAADWWSVGIILFELITGIPPFSDRLPEMIFNNILNRKIPWPQIPSEMSNEAKDLIDRFLTQDQNLRLGAKGASEVKDHCFFKDIDWDNLALCKAAFVPQPDSADDTSYFMSRYSQESPVYKEFCDCSDAITYSIEKKVEKNDGIRESDSGNLLDLLSTKFSFKNRNQLASMTYDILLQNGKTSNCSSPSRGPHVETDLHNMPLQ